MHQVNVADCIRYIQEHNYTKLKELRMDPKGRKIYSWAKVHKCTEILGMLENAIPRRTNEDLLATAQKYSTVNDLATHDESAYILIRRRNLQQECFAHMEATRASWSVDKIREEARKFSDFPTFRKSEFYAPALYYGILPELHQNLRSVWDTRKGFYIYSYDFEDGARYIGLTLKPAQRDWEHRHKKLKYGKKPQSTGVMKYHELTGLVIPEIRILHSKLTADEAARLEWEEIEKAKAIGTKLLNKHTGGGLGAYGRRKLPGKDEVLRIALEYVDLGRVTFKRDHWCSFKSATLDGYLDEVWRIIPRKRSGY